jgi:hypothetical protein
MKCSMPAGKEWFSSCISLIKNQKTAEERTAVHLERQQGPTSVTDKFPQGRQRRQTKTAR